MNPLATAIARHPNPKTRTVLRAMCEAGDLDGVRRLAACSLDFSAVLAHVARALAAELGDVAQTLEGIARDAFGIATLETRKSDDLDFHDVAVWQIRAALEAAYRAGAAAKRRH